MFIKEVRTEGASFAGRVFPRACSVMSIAQEMPKGEKFYALGFTYAETISLTSFSETARLGLARIVGRYMRDREKTGVSPGICSVSLDDLIKNDERKMAASN